MNDNATPREKSVALNYLWQRLSDEYCTWLDGWEMVMDHRPKRRLGQCRYRSKTIGISSWIIRACSWEQIEDTLKHEIAHAMAGPGYGHGPEWKRMCRMIGADPLRLAKLSPEELARMPKTPRQLHGYKYLAVCENCGTIPGVGKMKMTRKWRNGGTHRTCGGQISWKQQW